MFFKGWWTALAPHAEGTETQDGLVYCRIVNVNVNVNVNFALLCLGGGG